MSLKNELMVIFTSKTQGALDPQNIGNPSGPLFTYLVGAWYMGKNLCESVISEKYMTLFGLPIKNEEDLFGPFNSQEELKKFMYIVAEELESQSIRFLTIDDFNKALAMSSSVGELQIKVREMSDKMENLEAPSEKDSLIKRIFSKNK
ncbi:MAG: hypothetical protein CME61_05250 [Halobacteriovoraceae bacterium]|nr:hypothetical protein [Halobacteriovoraceae bacterium]